MATAGIASRRACEELIAAGRVTVNGQVAQLGDQAGWQDRVVIDGVPLTDPQTTVHFLVNKPVGVVCTASDPQGRPTVVELATALLADLADLPPNKTGTPPGTTSRSQTNSTQRLYPVGRLDADSEGAIIVTNDGELTQLLTHPSHGVAKEYLVHVQGKPSRTALRMLRNGVELADGLTAPARVSQPQDSVLSLVIHEGRNRQIRRMCEAVGHPVKRLIRTRIGPVSQDVAPGKGRRLTQAEVRSLYEAADYWADESPASGWAGQSPASDWTDQSPASDWAGQSSA